MRSADAGDRDGAHSVLNPGSSRDDPVLMDALAVAASGIQSGQLRLAASAHDVANLLTPGVRPLRTTQQALPAGGSLASARQEPAPREVELAAEFVEQIRAGLQVRASLRAFAAGADTRGQLLDLRA